MEIRIIYLNFSPIMSQTMYSTEHLHNIFRRDMLTAQIATLFLLHSGLWQGKKVKTLSNKQLPSEYGFGL